MARGANVETLRVWLVILRTLLFMLLLPDMLTLSGGSEPDEPIGNAAIIHHSSHVMRNDTQAAAADNSPPQELPYDVMAMMLLRLLLLPDAWLFAGLSHLLWGALASSASAATHIRALRTVPLRARLMAVNVYSLRILCALSCIWRLASLGAHAAAWSGVSSGFSHPALWYRSSNHITLSPNAWASPYAIVDGGVVAITCAIWWALRALEQCDRVVEPSERVA